MAPCGELGNGYLLKSVEVLLFLSFVPGPDGDRDSTLFFLFLLSMLNSLLLIKAINYHWPKKPIKKG